MSRRTTLCLAVALAFFAGCQGSSHAPMSFKEILIRQHMIEGWRYRGIVNNDLVFDRDVPGGIEEERISWLDPDHPRRNFYPTQHHPW